MASLASRLMKAAGGFSVQLEKSEYIDKGVVCKLPVAIANLMQSGKLNGGLIAGSTICIGDSRCFKTQYGMVLAGAYMREYPEAAMLFFDSEFGSKMADFENYGIDTSRVIHIPFTTVEELKSLAAKALDEIALGDKVFIMIDSVSQVASQKESQDALDDKAVADMTRAKQLNSFWRIVTPHLNMKKIPLYAINSYYDDISTRYGEKLVKGGKQGVLSADTILMVTRAQDKDAEGLKGWTFTYSTYKSRFVREKSKFAIRVSYDGGIDYNSGLFELALDGGFLTAPKQGWYAIQLPGYDSSANKRRKAIEEDQAFFDNLMKHQPFLDFVEGKFAFFNAANEHEELGVDKETGEVLFADD